MIGTDYLHAVDREPGKGESPERHKQSDHPGAFLLKLCLGKTYRRVTAFE